MVKSIIKEIIIILLLLIAVLLALGVLFYDYIPTNKTVPSVSTYKTAESVAKELQEQVTGNETVLVTYEITSEDLKQLERTKDYDAGKVNPFSSYETPVENTQDTNNVANGTNSINGNVGTSNSGTTSGNTFYKDTGTK